MKLSNNYFFTIREDVKDEEISFSGAISKWKESKEKVHVNYSTLIDLLSNGNI